MRSTVIHARAVQAQGVVFGFLFLLCLSPMSAQESLPSAQVSHPAIAEKETDYRLRKDPAEQQALAEQVMAIDLDVLMGYIRKDNGVYMTFPCTECGNRLMYTFDNPEALTCSKCGAVLNEEVLPPTGAIEGSGPKGDHVVLNYHHQGWAKDFFVAPLMRNLRHYKLAEAARALGRRYHDSGEERYAARAVAILDGLAQAYPHWPVVEIKHFPRPAKVIIEPERPYGHWVNVKWRHSHNYDVPYDLTFAYDFVYTADEWQRRPGARARVENDLLRGGYRHAWTVHEDMGRQVNNLSGTLIASTILLGRTLNDPDMVHRAVHTLEQMLRVFYHFDGFEYEGSLVYHGTVTGRAAIAERMLAGYSSPPGYQDEVYGVVLDGTPMAERIPVYRRAWDIWNMMRFPNGNPICINDTQWPRERKPVPPDAEAKTIQLNAYGFYSLGRGTGPAAAMACLHFPIFEWQSHYHADRLGLILFAAEEELLSDIGYVHVRRKNRYFANAAISHNNVVIEYAQPRERPERLSAPETITGTIARPRARMQLNRSHQESRAALLAYDPGVVPGQPVQILAASTPGPEDNPVGPRTRELLMIALDEERTCVVDIFRVQGGVRHNFVLKPSSDEDVLTEALTLSLGDERPGTLAGMDIAYGEAPRNPGALISYSWLVHKLRTASASGDWMMSWLGQDSEARLRVFVAGMNEAELWLGQSPTMRRADNNDQYADDFQNPHAILRCPEKGGGNTFVAVYEPVAEGKEAAVADVSFDVAGGGDARAAVSVRITTVDGTDVVVSAVCEDAGEVQGIQPRYSLQATRGNARLWSYRQGHARQRFALRKVLRQEDGDDVNGFVIAGRMAADAVLPGQWIRVLYGGGRSLGYGVANVTPRADDTLIELTGEPGFTCEDDTMRMLFYPFYETPGRCEVEIAVPVVDIQ